MAMTLADLFPTSDRAHGTQRQHGESYSLDTAHRPDGAATPARADGLDNLFQGHDRLVLTDTQVLLANDVASLARLVESTVASKADFGNAPQESNGHADTKQRGRRPRLPRDWVATALAVLAVVAVIGTAGLAVHVAASASPIDDAMRTLRQSEAVLGNEIRSVDTSIARLDAARADGTEAALGLAAPLALVNGASDEGARAAAESERANYVAAVSALRQPGSPPAYEGAGIDDDISLEQLAGLIDEVSARSHDVAQEAAEVDAVSADLAALDTSFKAAMRSFAATVPATAAEIVAANPDAEESFRATVTDTAALVAASATDTLGAALSAYAQAATALQADQQRALAVIAEEAEQQRLRNLRYLNDVTPQQPDDAGDPSVQDPATDTGGDTQPEPTPEPSPTVPDPEPTTSPSG